MIKITLALVAAYRATVPARAALSEVPWAELPDLLRACGLEQRPEVAQVIEAGIGDGSARDLVTIRGVLAMVGDVASRASQHSGRTHSPQKACAAMCAELVGLTGAALALLDVSGQIV